jgi:hypothetical protein
MSHVKTIFRGQNRKNGIFRHILDIYRIKIEKKKHAIF